mmetsp:Transcript_5340/g.11233  ORF Transcript_5340/g.11233 Transcript_5340/m.11233 type:complete len:243 (-) Transcript_5340:426-1154(-)
MIKGLVLVRLVAAIDDGFLSRTQGVSASPRHDVVGSVGSVVGDDGIRAVVGIAVGHDFRSEHGRQEDLARCQCSLVVVRPVSHHVVQKPRIARPDTVVLQSRRGEQSEAGIAFETTTPLVVVVVVLVNIGVPEVLSVRGLLVESLLYQLTGLAGTVHCVSVRRRRAFVAKGVVDFFHQERAAVVVDVVLVDFVVATAVLQLLPFLVIIGRPRRKQRRQLAVPDPVGVVPVSLPTILGVNRCA